MKQAIGFIDSGVGGLTVVKEALKQLPNESIIYLGDSARCPYGPRPAEEILSFTWELVRFLLSKQVKMIVIACNTATAIALDEIQQHIDIPIVGVIHPGSVAAIKQTKNQRIGILGTIGTIDSGVYQKTIQAKKRDIVIHNLACPKFVPLVESNQTHSAVAKKVVFETLKPLKQKGCDTVVLGCTHYPLLKDAIQNVLGENVHLIDSGVETITTVSTLLDYFHIAETADTNPTPKHEYFTTGSIKLFKQIAQQWLNDSKIEVKKVDLTPYKQKENYHMPELLIATKNQGKANEFRQLFAEKGYQIKTLLDYPEIEDIEETGKTFEENARLKAETIAKQFQTIVLADDSGLMVDALGGQPGVYSARYAGEGHNDSANNAKLLAELGALPLQNRKASFHCTLVLAAPGVDSLVVEGKVDGEIALFPSGENGFGYDPLFYVKELNKTFAELSSTEKNQFSHRSKAIEQLTITWDEWIKEVNALNEGEKA